MRVWEKMYELVEGCARILFVPCILDSNNNYRNSTGNLYDDDTNRVALARTNLRRSQKRRSNEINKQQVSRV